MRLSTNKHLVLEQVRAKLRNDILVVDLERVRDPLPILSLEDVVQQKLELVGANVGRYVHLGACGGR